MGTKGSICNQCGANDGSVPNGDVDSRARANGGSGPSASGGTQCLTALDSIQDWTPGSETVSIVAHIGLFNGGGSFAHSAIVVENGIVTEGGGLANNSEVEQFKLELINRANGAPDPIPEITIFDLRSVIVVPCPPPRGQSVPVLKVSTPIIERRRAGFNVGVDTWVRALRARVRSRTTAVRRSLASRH